MTRRGFTFLDLMIVVTILGILAAIVHPLVRRHLDTAEETAAQTTYRNVRKALDLYFQSHQDWPDTVEPTLFKPPEPVTMPLGSQLVYDPDSGELNLVELDPEDAEDAPAVLVVGAVE